MEILAFRHNGNILLMLDKATIDIDSHSRQIAQILQAKLEGMYPEDWEEIAFSEDCMLYIEHPLYEWHGDNGMIRIVGEIYKVRNIMQEVFSVV